MFKRERVFRESISIDDDARYRQGMLTIAPGA